MRNDTNFFAANVASADAQVSAENVAASRGRTSNPDVAAAMVAFARAQIRRRTGRSGPDRSVTAPPTILRLVE